MENLVIDTYSRRLQDMARSAARVSKGSVFCMWRFADTSR